MVASISTMSNASTWQQAWWHAWPRGWQVVHSVHGYGAVDGWWCLAWLSACIVCTPPFFIGWRRRGGEGLNFFTKFSKSGGLRGPQLWERVTSFRKGGDAIFTKNKKLNLKYLTTKKVYKKKHFSVITKNSNWEILRI